MEQGGEAETRLVDLATRMGAPVPEKIANAPRLMPGLEFYYRAFLDLCTCRSIGMSEGPIPFTAVSEYARRFNLDDEGFHVLLSHTKNLDVTFLNYRESQRKK